MRRRSADGVISGPPRIPFYNNPRIRGVLYQLILLVALIWLAYEFVINVRANLAAQGFSSGFGFMGNTAGFGVSQSLIAYSESDSYGRVFVVGLLNTLLVSAIGIVFATLLGFVIGLARLSQNWLVARLAGGYVEVFRNNRGVIVPAPLFGEGASYVGGACLLGILATIALARWARHRQDLTGKQFPVFVSGIGLIIGIPFLVLATLGFPISFETPQLRGFNFVGGIRLIPEFIALLIALSTYTAAYIAEVVRAGVQSVPHGQSEAALGLGFKRGLLLRLIVVPQALRVMVPLLTNQYLNLTKNSTLGVAIGYPDLFGLFAGTTLNQTHQAIEVIAITMAVYLVISLVTSFVMNWYNMRLRLVE